MPPLKKSLDTTLPPQAAESYLYPVSCDVSFMGKEKTSVKELEMICVWILVR